MGADVARLGGDTVRDGDRLEEFHGEIVRPILGHEVVQARMRPLARGRTPSVPGQALVDFPERGTDVAPGTVGAANRVNVGLHLLHGAFIFFSLKKRVEKLTLLFALVL